MSNKKLPNSPPAKQKTGIVQADTKARSANKSGSKKSTREVLPSPQAQEPSENTKLAAGEPPFISQNVKTTVVPKTTTQVSEAMRDLSIKTIDQAEKAFGTFFDAVGRSLVSIPSPRTEISKHALSSTEQNVKAVFDHARKLIQATDLKQVMQIQSDFLKSQFTNNREHMRQMIVEITSPAKDESKE